MWYWRVGGDGLDVWDHTQDPATDAPLASGVEWSGSWSAPAPQAVLDEMHARTVEALDNDNVQYAIAVVLAATFGQIKRV